MAFTSTRVYHSGDYSPSKKSAEKGDVDSRRLFGQKILAAVGNLKRAPPLRDEQTRLF
jgi:hypothetical protein